MSHIREVMAEADLPTGTGAGKIQIPDLRCRIQQHNPKELARIPS